ncbi:MAG: FAD-binding oxidoreductase [Gammaproteobacteria bacterium]|nr:FAD-binding oxidoreductase [Gammaproteobacteria bacterium]MYD77043.1 FAD-binding oxidoreductase [Gammaproteobacteria bacterium]MYJ53119.1 FAD-binding oxidoreductase [Gammaproteobacteria bacterium]
MTDRRARRLPAHRGPAAWSEILGPQDPLQTLESDETADFAIVGAGFAGLAAARRLLQIEPRARIVVLEAGRIAEGASGRNSGFMIDLPHDLSSEDYAGKGVEADRALIALNRQAIAFAEDAVEEYGIDRNFFDKAGKVNAAASAPAHRRNLAYAGHLDRLAEPSEMLDDRQMREWTGSSHYLSGLYTPGTVMLQPAGYVRALAKGLRQSVRILENSPVRELERSGNCWRVKTPRGTVSAGRIILANNGHLESFGYARRRLMHLFLYASMTPELDSRALGMLGGRPRWGITPSDPMGTSMRRIDTTQGGNRILTRTCATVRPGMAASARDVERAARVHRRKFEQRFPQLEGLRQEYSWAGQLCLTLNAVAVMGEVDENVFAACVQNGLGTVRGTLTGIGAAEFACGVASGITRHFTAEHPPRRLPPEPFAAIGANAWIRYREWRAKDE